MIDSGLESDYEPYKLGILLFFLMSSVAQLEVEISTYFNEGVGYVGSLEILGLNFDIIPGHRS